MIKKKSLHEALHDPTAEHYEEKFEFPLWIRIRTRAEQDNISYSAAAALVAPDYAKTLRIRDQEWTDAQIHKRQAEGNKEIMATDKLH